MGLRSAITHAEYDSFAVLTSDLVELLDLTGAQYSTWIELEKFQFSIVLHCPKWISSLPMLSLMVLTPFLRCQNSIVIDLNDHKDMKLLTCPLRSCNHIWCKDCQLHVEPGTQHSCDGSLELGELMKKQGWRYCPGA